MKAVITIAACLILMSCVKVETDGVAHETGNLIRDGVKGGIELYKESKKNDTIKPPVKPDTVSFWDKTRNTVKEVKKTIKTIKEE
jgi:hypothetical protein